MTSEPLTEPRAQVSLCDVLRTEELTRRPARSPDYAAENQALHQLARMMAADSSPMLQALVQMAVDLCDAGTGGLSLIEDLPGGKQVFRWVAMAGALASAVGGTSPRDWSPCGYTLDRGTPQLFASPDRHFTPGEPLGLKIAEVLVVPLPVADAESIGGTIWIVSHDEHRRFDQEDARIMGSLAAFTAAALRVSRTAAENRRLYQEARRAVQQREVMIGSVSHDLRNPLASILGNAQLLLRRARRWNSPESELLVDRLGKIEQTSQRLSAQLDELIDHASLEAGRSMELRRAPVDLAVLVFEIVDEYTGKSARHRIRVDNHVQNLVGIWDQMRLGRVIDNLLSNAVKYSPDGGEVVVRLVRDNDAVLISVTDQGIGIPEADLPRLFQRFYRASNSVGRINGIGLGLAGARQVVEAHNGTIDVQSEVGVGTTVTIRLPLAN